MWYHFSMASEIESLQERIDAIRATGDAELAGRAWHALSKVLFEFARKKLQRRKFPITRRVSVDDVDWLVSNLKERHQAH